MSSQRWCSGLTTISKRRARNRAADRPDKSVDHEERRRLLWIVAAPIIELGSAGVAMTGGFLHIFKLGACSSAMTVVRECARGAECGAQS